MNYKRLLTFQDISCVGQCSLTVALPVLSVCGIETCVLPSMVLSTHTGGFKDITKADLTDYLSGYLNSWRSNNISFDVIYTGYLGNLKQIEIVKRLKDEFLNPGGLLIVDPVMGDDGELYSGFDDKYVDEVRKLCEIADIIIPNLTEACLLARKTHTEQFSNDELTELLENLAKLGPRTVVLTGISETPEYAGATIYENGKIHFAKAVKQPGSFACTGDLFASVFTGTLIRTGDVNKAADRAAEFVSETIAETIKNPGPGYGIRFEGLLGKLLEN
ncbi:MAG: pyridoxamine kinase [Lachnospiraceae bacterium]|nr:pyridoxamine kinase [Lachnospiraceae bacterium]